MMWHAMTGPQRHLSEGDDRARRYPIDLGPFCAIPDEPSGEHFGGLRDLVGPGNVATLFRGDVEVPDDWEVIGRYSGIQMMGPASVNQSIDSRIVTLGAHDAADMMSLASRRKPGPFAERTWELGTFLGVRVDGRLVAMAGQRAQTSEYVEISAVCTDEEYVGQGLGSALVVAQIANIIESGRQPMLHAATINPRAIALYEHLGFTRRRLVARVIIRSPL
jgi:ribosomal protein S18 acetylase RimI-like enzyme